MTKKNENTSFPDSLINKISEKKYLFAVALLFFIITIIFGLDLVYFILPLEHELTINLFTSALFTFLTIVFLSFFLILRNEREWRIVKDEVYFMIKNELAILFLGILKILENGIEYGNTLSITTDKEERKKLILQKLQEKKLKINETYTNLFLTKPSVESYIEISKKISNIEHKYSKHLPVELTFYLIKLQQDIELLNYTISIQPLMDNIKNQLSTLGSANLSSANEMSIEIIKEILDKLSNITKDFRFEKTKVLQLPINNLFLHIGELYRLGCDFDYLLHPRPNNADT